MLSFKLWILWVYIPVHVIKISIKLLDKSVDANDLLNFLRLIYAHEYPQDVHILKFKPPLTIKPPNTKEVIVELKGTQST